MKLFFTLSFLALAASVTAEADFVPGRVRPLALAQMEVVSASGEFARLNQAILYQNFEDARGFVSLKLALSGHQTILLPINKVQKGSCGNLAWSDEVPVGSGVVSTLFSDYSEAACTVFRGKEWKLKVEMSDAAGNRSTLELEGKPEHLFGTH